jgi:signal transduction histidine kinase
MRSLYAKIVLWFWLAMVLVVATLVVGIDLTQSRVEKAYEEERDTILLPLLAERYAKVYEEQGTKALVPLQTPGVPHGYFLDEAGQDVLGQPVPRETRALIQRASQTDETQIEGEGGRHFAARRTTATSGKRYVLLLDLKPPLPPFLRDTSRIQVLRLASVLLMAGLVCLWLARYITAPVSKLRHIAKELAKGNLSARVGSAGAKRRDELGDLARDFDNMAEQIEDLMSSQQRLIRDISHELRSPLARLNVALGLARRNAGPEIEGSLDRIEREADRLNELIGVLLKLARLESGSEATNRETIDLEQVVREVTSDANFEAQSRNVTVRVVKAELCSIRGIREALRSALENVLRNAVNYTAEGTEVEVALDQIRDAGQDLALIQVRDHGEGIPEQLLQNIFKPFYRVADARERSSGGAGLGLTITERIVHLHGGSVEARNSAQGGLVVELRFPLTSDLASQPERDPIPLQAS